MNKLNLTDEQKIGGMRCGVREERSIKLAESDWTQLPDNHLSDTKKTQWAVYRQVLRDLPSTVNDPTTSWDSIIWPTSPQYL